MKLGWAGAALLLALASAPAAAVEPGEALADPNLEARARRLSTELRCLVCQNQSIDDSDAPLARDLRLLVRDRLKAGASDSQVVDFVVGRYGEFVLLRPVIGAHTILLWLGPALVLALAVGGIVLARRRAPSPGATDRLSAEEESRIASLLEKERG